MYFPALKQILALLDGLGDPLRVGEVARCVLRVREGFEPLLHLFGSAEETEVPSAVGDHGAPGLALTLRLAEVAEEHHPAAGPDFADVQAIEIVVINPVREDLDSGLVLKLRDLLSARDLVDVGKDDDVIVLAFA